MNNYNLDTNTIFISNLFDEYVTSGIQEVNLPGMSIGNQKMPSRREQIMTNITFENVEYSPLILNIILDEDMKNWNNFVQLMLKNRVDGFFEDHKDGILVLRGNNGQLANRIFFRNISVVSISDLQYSTTGDNTEQTFTVEVMFDWFDIEAVADVYNNVFEPHELLKEIQEAYKNRDE